MACAAPLAVPVISSGSRVRPKEGTLSKLVPAHGGGGLKPRLVEGEGREAETAKAARLKRVPMTSRETSDLIMLGIGYLFFLAGLDTVTASMATKNWTAWRSAEPATRSRTDMHMLMRRTKELDYLDAYEKDDYTITLLDAGPNSGRALDEPVSIQPGKGHPSSAR